MPSAKKSKTVIGIIGGSGVYKIDGIKILKEHRITTPFGRPSSPVIEARLDQTTFFFIPRHGIDHSFSPSEINYCANIYALKKMGVRYLVSFSAVGSLKEELPPGTIVLPDQFIDLTKGLRRRSFFGQGVVGHVSVALPVEKQLQNAVAGHCRNLNIAHSVGGSYVCIEGPQFSSKAESAIYRAWEAAVIGMTNVPEAYLAKEAGMAYATVAMVTDYDCWKETHCTLPEIMKIMHQNNQSAHKILAALLPELAENPFDYIRENQNAIMTNPKKFPLKTKAALKVILE